MIILLCISFIALAAVCKAVADTLRDHYDTSIFRAKDPRFWNPQISWKYVGVIKFTKYHPDAWHLCNSLMLCFLDAAVVAATALYWHWKWWEYGLEFVLIGILFNVVFNLFYNRILKK